MKSEFMDTANFLLENPVVKNLANYNHHMGKTRLEHVKEVAWISFFIGKKLSLDSRAIIRGGLLHDLFFMTGCVNDQGFTASGIIILLLKTPAK